MRTGSVIGRSLRVVATIRVQTDVAGEGTVLVLLESFQSDGGSESSKCLTEAIYCRRRESAEANQAMVDECPTIKGDSVCSLCQTGRRYHICKGARGKEQSQECEERWKKHNEEIWWKRAKPMHPTGTGADLILALQARMPKAGITAKRHSRKKTLSRCARRSCLFHARRERLKIEHARSLLALALPRNLIAAATSLSAARQVPTSTRSRCIK